MAGASHIRPLANLPHSRNGPGIIGDATSGKMPSWTGSYNHALQDQICGANPIAKTAGKVDGPLRLRS